MHRYRHPIVGIALDDSGKDVSPGSRQAVEQALWFAERGGGRVVIYHALGDGESARPAPAAVPPEGAKGDLAFELAPRAVADFVRGLARPGRPIAFEIGPGPASIAMSRRAARDPEHVVVVARRNALNPRSKRIGTVSGRLVRICPTPVWVVHAGRPFPHRNVLAATDLTPVGDLASQLAAWFARELGAQLELVHAWQYPMELEMERSSLGEAEFVRRVEEITEQCRKRVLSGFAGLDRGVATKIHIGNAVPSQAIHELIERYDVDMLVLGTIARSGIPGALIGNTAERLLQEVDVSLVAVKPEGFQSPALA